MIRFLYRLNQFPLVQLILSLCVLACSLAALYGVVLFIHEYIGNWYYYACGISLLIFRWMAKNAPLESEHWPQENKEK